MFVGGCATGLLVTDPAASPVRATRDVDVVVEVASLAGYPALERQLEQAGFKHDRSQDVPVCRWIAGGCMLDVMSTDEKVLGFGNRWYHVAVRTAESVRLPSGRSIRLIAPPVFLATKLAAGTAGTTQLPLPDHSAEGHRLPVKTDGLCHDGRINADTMSGFVRNAQSLQEPIGTPDTDDERANLLSRRGTLSRHQNRGTAFRRLPLCRFSCFRRDARAA